MLLYGHYDVQPAPAEQGWHTDPFSPTLKDGRLYGRGAADDKSGIMQHAASIRLYDGRPPVGIKILIEGEEEYGSKVLFDLLSKEPHRVEADAALVAMPDPRLQERACAFVTLKHGQSLDLAAIARHLAAEGFTKHFWPERLEVLAEMPRTPTGKIQKFVLRGMAKDLRPETESSVKAA